MNILIPHSWLKDYLVTKASPQKIAACLSLCGASVEKIEKKGKDWIYDIEVTTNRVDMMSVVGIAREIATILPQFGIKAKFKKDPYNKKLKITSPLGKQIANSKTSKPYSLKVVIKNKNLCPRFSAVVLDNLTIKPSPKKVSQRLENSNIRSLNNLVDISNYLMRALGQPVHTFDYDKIKKHTMILRESKKGEEIITLDGKKHILPGKDIVIEDGAGRLIDLCGIMGAQNSAVDKNTKRVLLFIQTYNPVSIRRTSMSLAHRTEAAQLFEKNTDPELVMPTLLQGIKLMQKMAKATVASKIYDIYPKPYKEKEINISLQFIKERLGVPVSAIKVKKILEDLGFKVSMKKNKNKSSTANYNLKVPSWRSQDIDIPEDIVEEVARIYGYHNLPSNLPTGKLPQSFDDNSSFYWESLIKNALRNWGYTETYTYSLQSRELLQRFRLEPEHHLKLKNPLSKDQVYLRTSILPSLLQVVTQNSQYESLHLFELSKVYLKQKRGLPYEVQRLSLVSYDDFFRLKGVAEQIMENMNIEVEFIPHEKISQLHPYRTAIIKSKKSDLILGSIGQVFQPILQSFKIEKPLTILDLNFDKLVFLAKPQKTYTSIPKYPPIIEDLTFTNKGRVLAKDVIEAAQKTHKLITKVKIIDLYKNRLSLRIVYQSRTKSLKDKEVAKIRKKIVQRLEKLGLNLHGKLN